MYQLQMLDIGKYSLCELTSYGLEREKGQRGNRQGFILNLQMKLASHSVLPVTLRSGDVIRASCMKMRGFGDAQSMRLNAFDFNWMHILPFQPQP
jgi:hypothetical protein